MIFHVMIFGGRNNASQRNRPSRLKLLGRFYGNCSLFYREEYG